MYVIRRDDGVWLGRNYQTLSIVNCWVATVSEAVRLDDPEVYEKFKRLVHCKKLTPTQAYEEYKDASSTA